MTAQRIGFLLWPGTKAMTLALAEEALRVAQRLHPEVVYDLHFLQAEAPAEGGWRLPGEPWTGKLEGLGLMLVGIILLLTALFVYNAPYRK